MRLKDLAAASDTSTASIKYYLREGLLPPGRRINATLAEYDDTHLARLQLIAALRRIVGTPVEEIRALVAMIDDPEEDLFRIFGRAQLLGLGLPGTSRIDLADEPADVTRLVESRGWVRATEVRALLGEHVRGMAETGSAPAPAILAAYADAAAQAAQVDVEAVVRATTRDEAVMRVAVGVHSYSRLLLRLLGVAQAAHAWDLLAAGTELTPRQEEGPTVSA